MSLERNYRSDNDRREYTKQSFSSTLNQFFQPPEQGTYCSSMPVASESPREHCEPFRSTSGSSSSDSSAANSTGLSVDSPIYPSLASSSSFLQASPSFYSTASPPTSLSPASPTGFLIPNLSHLPCNNSSCFSHARSNCSSLQCYSSGIQSDLSSGSPVTSSSSGSSVNNQPTDSQYLDIAVALRNIGADTIQRRIPSRDNSSPGDEPQRLPSPYETSFTYDNQTPLQSADSTPHDSLMWHVNNSIQRERMISHCLENIHPENQQRYCLTCSRPFCEGCHSSRHSIHTSISFLKFLKRSEEHARETMSELRAGLSSIQNALENVQLDAEMLEQKAKEAAADVMICTRRLVSAVEAREKNLLNMIEKARVLKFASLKAKDESLRNDKARLIRATDRLCAAIGLCSSICNPKDLLANKDMALAEIFQIEQNRRYQSTREENWISFTGPGNNLWHAITTLGTIVTTNPGPIGEGRAIYGSNSSQLCRGPFSIRASPRPIVRPRPITNNSFPVAVRDNQSYRVVQIIGNNGDVADNICRPWGVTCDKRGHIIVADRSNNRIQIYREDGTLVRRFGSAGTGAGEFDRPAGITVDSWQRIIVADKDNHRIQILLMDGTFVHEFGKKGYEPGDFNYPWDVAVNSECQIVVSDTRNHRVQLFSPDGTFLRMYGYDTQPNMMKQFDSPRGVCFTPKGELIITDFNNHHLVIVDEWFTEARVINCEAVDGGNRAFLRPQGLVVDRNGNIIVADSRNHRIQVFDSDGRFLWKYGTQGVGPNEMDRPAGIALLPDGKIAIVDFGNNRVLLLKKQ